MLVPETVSPIYCVVNNYRHELSLLRTDRLTSISIAVPRRGAEIASVMYLRMASRGSDGSQTSSEALATCVQLLQLLASPVGELLQRNVDIRYTVRAIGAQARATFHDSSDLQRAIETQMAAMVNHDIRIGSPGSPDDRVAMVLLTVSSSTEAPREVSEWLAEQLQHVSARTFLAPWSDSLDDFDNWPDPVCGQLQGGAAILVIGRRNSKTDLDALRAALPERINRLGYGHGRGDLKLARLNVWVIDERWEDIANAASKDGDSSEAPVGGASSGNLSEWVRRMLRRATSAADVAADNIDAYDKAIVRGDWQAALDHVQRGLDTNPSNPYLRRRKAEFLLRMGDFRGAEEEACLALRVHHDRSPMAVLCLLADALLGQGQLRRALLAYTAANRADRGHPYPPYAKASALLLVSDLIERDIQHHPDAADPLALAGWIKDQDYFRGVQQQLEEVAGVILRQNTRNLKRIGTPGIYGIKEIPAAPHAHASVAAARRTSPERELREIRKAMSQNPADDGLYRAFLRASISMSAARDRMLADLRDHSRLQRVLSAGRLIRIDRTTG